MVIDKEKIIVQDAVRRVCDLFAIDPYSSISEGTLIITCRPRKAQEVARRLRDKGILVSMVGEIVDGQQGMRFFEGGISRELIHPKVDPFWSAFGKAASQGR
jgi:hydrogenase expression/formation protein HypE